MFSGKRFYQASEAQKEYESVLSEPRQGISKTEDEMVHINSVLSPLLMKGQSVHHICENNRDQLMSSQSTIYRYVDSGLLSARNIDLPRKVRFGARKVKVHAKVDRKCRIGRTYQDFLAYTSKHPDVPITELDSVEGRKGLLFTRNVIKFAWIG